MIKLLAENSPAELNELKDQTGLSNKKWDLAIKGLRKHNLAKAEKNDEDLFGTDVSLIGIWIVATQIMIVLIGLDVIICQSNCLINI